MIFFLSACDNNTNNLPTVEKINGIEVPPAPDKTKNNATLAGVDSNSNGVRDDVERDVAKLSGNEVTFKNSMDIAKELGVFAKATAEIKKTDIDNIYNNIMCKDYAVYKSTGKSIEKVINEIIFNTKERKDAFTKATLSYGGGEGDINECN